MTLRTLTMTVLAATTTATASALLAPAAHAAPATRSAGATARSALLDAFAHHRVVALGLAGGLRQQDDFIFALLRHPRFAATVDSIVVEFGNARFQQPAELAWNALALHRASTVSPTSRRGKATAALAARRTSRRATSRLHGSSTIGARSHHRA